MKPAEIIIIGGGACGLIIAAHLSGKGRRVVILEAQERLGGRICTEQGNFLMPVEPGAEFIHGTQPITKKLLKKYGIPFYRVEGHILQKENGLLLHKEDFIDNEELLLKKLKALKHDISIAGFLKKYFSADLYRGLRESVQRYVSGYEAGDIERYSSFALRDEFASAGYEQYRVEGGYIRLIKALEKECLQNGCEIYTGTPVQSVKWQKNYVAACSNKVEFTGSKAAITLPLGILALKAPQKGGIEFKPAVKQLQQVRKLGFGNVVKCVLQFEKAYWHTLQRRFFSNTSINHFFFLFSDERIPTWWTQYPLAENIVCGWLAGPATEKAGSTEKKILAHALASLAEILNEPAARLKKNLEAGSAINWHHRPYAGGAYSYSTVGGEAAIKALTEPVEDTLFFAGEALNRGINIATVEAALASGLATAKNM